MFSEYRQMKLISTLQEASGHSIEDLKKVMQKDKRISAVFQKHLDLEDISNPGEFLSTVKFFLLNNRNVIEFVEGRDYVNALDKRTLKRLRELKVTELKQKDIDDLLEFVVVLFREHAHVERSGLTASTRKEIVEWINANGRYFDLTAGTQRELLTVPGLRPTRPTLLYRGLLFSGSNLRERKRYDGQLEVGDGLKFLRSVREGTRIVDLEWDRASSWTASKQVAMQFARFGPAQSNFSATIQWLHREDEKRAIDGDLGFIISTLAQPEDILIDTSRLVTQMHLKHQGESEMILKPGEYTCRVSVKYDKTGEVDPIKTAEISDDVRAVVEAVQEFAKTWKIPESSNLETGHWSGLDVQRILRDKNIEGFMLLASPETKKEALESYAALKKLYVDHIAPLSTAQLETLKADQSIGKIVDWVTSLQKKMTETTKHSAFRTSENSRGKVSQKDLTPEQYRESKYASLHKNLEDASGGGRFTDRSAGQALSDLLSAFANAPGDDLHRKGRKEQEEALDKILAGFFKAINVDQPTDRAEGIKKMKSVILGAERNAGVISNLTHFKKSLNDALGLGSDKE